MFYPRKSGFEFIFILAFSMQQFCPKLFWSVDPSFVCGKIYLPFIRKCITVIGFLREVWPFQNTNIAFGFSSKPGINERGVPTFSTATCVEPVVSTEMPTLFSATSVEAFFFCASVMFYSNPSKQSNGCWRNWNLGRRNLSPLSSVGIQILHY